MLRPPYSHASAWGLSCSESMALKVNAAALGNAAARCMGKMHSAEHTKVLQNVCPCKYFPCTTMSMYKSLQRRPWADCRGDASARGLSRLESMALKVNAAALGKMHDAGRAVDPSQDVSMHYRPYRDYGSSMHGGSDPSKSNRLARDSSHLGGSRKRGNLPRRATMGNLTELGGADSANEAEGFTLGRSSARLADGSLRGGRAVGHCNTVLLVAGTFPHCICIPSTRLRNAQSAYLACAACQVLCYGGRGLAQQFVPKAQFHSAWPMALSEVAARSCDCYLHLLGAGTQTACFHLLPCWHMHKQHQSMSDCCPHSLQLVAELQPCKMAKGVCPVISAPAWLLVIKPHSLRDTDKWWICCFLTVVDLLQLTALQSLSRGAADYMDASLRGGRRFTDLSQHGSQHYTDRSQHGSQHGAKPAGGSLRKGWSIGGSGRLRSSAGGLLLGKNSGNAHADAHKPAGDSVQSLTPQQLNGIFHSPRRQAMEEPAGTIHDSSTRPNRCSRSSWSDSDRSHGSRSVNVFRPL